MARIRFRRFVPKSWAVRIALLVAVPLCALNLSVAFFGNSVVFPLSPFFLSEKLQALKLYARHRPFCLLSGHEDLSATIAIAEKKHGVPTGLLAALVEVESENKVHRISAAGAMGPGQLMVGTAAMLNVKDPFDPAVAIDGSARYLGEQYRKRQNVQLALAAYNAGPGNVGLVVPKNGETEFYVKKVMAAYARRGGGR